MEKFTNFIAFLCLAGVGVLGQENVFQCNSCVDAECQRTEQQQCNSSCYVTFKPESGTLINKGCSTGDNLSPKLIPFRHRKMGQYQCSEYGENRAQCLCYSDKCNTNHQTLIQYYGTKYGDVSTHYAKRTPKYDNQVYEVQSTKVLPTEPTEPTETTETTETTKRTKPTKPTENVGYNTPPMTYRVNTVKNGGHSSNRPRILPVLSWGFIMIFVNSFF